MHTRGNWDDLRYVLAVAEAGSVSGAARTLGVNHATVLRRVAAFENRYDVEVFDKTARGYAISPDRLRVIDAAREVETAIQTVSQIIKGTKAPLRGVVRVTSTDTFCHGVLPEIVTQVQGRAEKLRIELLSSNAHLDLSQLHADITVRPATSLADDLSGERAGQLGFDVYTKTNRTSSRWLGLSGPLARTNVAEWLNETVPSEDIAGSADSFVTLREMAAAGMGIAILPCIVGDNDPRLERRHGIMPDTSVTIWVASHADLADVPRIREVRRLLVNALAEKSDQLAGRVV